MRSLLFSCIIVLLALTGCSNAPGALKPMPWIFNHMPHDGSPEYKQGWKDGCETGLSSMTNDYYRAFYQYRVDVNLVNNETYYRAWKDTFNYCRHYAYGTLKESDLRMKLPGAGISQPGDDVHGVFNFGGVFKKSGFFDNW